MVGFQFQCLILNKQGYKIQCLDVLPSFGTQVIYNPVKSTLFVSTYTGVIRFYQLKEVNLVRKAGELLLFRDQVCNLVITDKSSGGKVVISTKSMIVDLDYFENLLVIIFEDKVNIYQNPEYIYFKL